MRYLSGLEELYISIRSIHEARYAMAAMCALQLYEWLSLSISRTLIQFIPQGVMMMRAYAFTSRNRRVLILLGACYAVLIGLNIWVFCFDVVIPVELYIVLGQTGCFSDWGDGGMGIRIGIAATSMDLISLIVVFVHCYRTRIQEISLGRYFVNQGLAAFAFVCAVNILCAVLYFKPPSFTSGIGLPLILVVPNLVVSRACASSDSPRRPDHTFSRHVECQSS
ncbi:hypothetical protein AN958_02885 [Leucoagaricus sp. SymC.cos]|nr:hypothetical protein AN958_02885 [Leucoagaricus sp. SymC.cos]